MNTGWGTGPRVRGFIEDLKKAGLEACAVPGSFMQYSVKIRVGPAGSSHIATIFHSPKKNTYKIDLRGIADPDMRETMEKAWHGDSARPGAGFHVYPDGSYIGGATGYGAVILKDNRVIGEICGPVSAEKAASTRQVAGEIEAVKRSLEWCVSRGASEVAVHYDYEGLKKWVTGEWRAKMPLTMEYRTFVHALGLKLIWKKVAAHCGDRWNERADHLAKKGASRAPAAPRQGELF